MRCIICLDSNPVSGFSDEHVFPESVGGTLVIRSVCTTCNGRLGHSVDPTVTNHSLIELKRSGLQLAGKTGKVPNPLERGVLRDDPDQKVQLRLDSSKPGGFDVYLLTSLTKTMTGPKEGRLNIRIDARDGHKLGDIVNKSLARVGARPLSEDQIEAIRQKVTRTEQPRVDVPFAVDLSDYRRGLAKIAYELACEWLGEDYVDEPIAALLRGFMFEENLPLDSSAKYPIRGMMRLAPPKPLLPFWPSEKAHLQAFMPPTNGSVPTNGAMSIYVSVLGMMDALVRVSDRRHHYLGRFVSIDPVTGVTRESTFLAEVTRLGEVQGAESLRTLNGIR